MKGHNSAEQLRSIVERIERLAEERDGIAADIREVYAEAKGNGYSPVALRQVVKERKLDASEREERDHILDTYRSALGLLPLFENAE
jgi:uncharacterized protein (UPF0335 family)